MEATIRYRGSWVIGDVDHDVGRYLRRLFLLTYGIKLERPSNSEHITIASSYEEKNTILWGVHEGEVVTCIPDMTLWTNGTALWIPIKSDRMEEIREELGLLRVGEIPLHFCVGYI